MSEYIDKQEFIECLKWAGWELQHSVMNPHWDLFLQSSDFPEPGRGYQKGDIWGRHNKTSYYSNFYKPFGGESWAPEYTYEALLKDEFFGPMLRHYQFILDP